MNNRLFLSIITIFLLFSINIYADDHSKGEVKNLIQNVKNEFNKIKTETDTTGSEEEIKQIQKHIKLADELLDDSEYDGAYFEINIASAYFRIIIARSELLKTQKQYDKIKKETGR